MSFHLGIVAAAHNPSLAETHKAYLQRLWRVRYLSASQRKSRERVLRQHGDILAGLDARDPERVKAAIGAHLQALADNIRLKYDDGNSGAGMADTIPLPRPTTEKGSTT